MVQDPVGRSLGWSEEADDSAIPTVHLGAREIHSPVVRHPQYRTRWSAETGNLDFTNTPPIPPERPRPVRYRSHRPSLNRSMPSLR